MKTAVRIMEDLRELNYYGNKLIVQFDKIQNYWEKQKDNGETISYIN